MHVNAGKAYIENGAANRQTKILLRDEAVKLFAEVESDKPILTFPGETWVTEKDIIEARAKLSRDDCKFICLEFNSKIYDKALLKIPYVTGLKILKKRHIITNTIEFKHQDFGETDYSTRPISCAWIDFVGPISPKRINSLVKLWDSIEHYLIVTSMRGRYSTPIHQEIQRSGSIGKLLQEKFTASYIVNEYAYGSSCAMHHVIFKKENKRCVTY